MASHAARRLAADSLAAAVGAGLRRRGVVLSALLTEAGRSLTTRRLHATASAIGLASSITAVVLLLSVVTGLRRFALDGIASAGGNVIVVTPAPVPAPPPDVRRLPAALRRGDETIVLAGSRYFELASAENSVETTVSVPGRGRAPLLEVRGITEAGFEILQVVASGGRLLTEDEHRQGVRSAVVGADAAVTLFGSDSPLGQRLEIGPWPFVVVGVLAWVGDPSAGMQSSLDTTVFVPFSAAAEAVHGDDRVSSLRFRLRELGTHAEAAIEARAALDRVRRLRGETGGDLRVTNTIERMRRLERVIAVMNVAVTVIGLVGLAAGAVGIANVLLTSVQERTVEIGVRRALGATRGAIFLGFLFEALAISLAGGLAGVFVAHALTSLAALLPQIPEAARPSVSLTTSLGAFCALVIVGVTAGVVPARRAAAVYPAEALRQE